MAALVRVAAPLALLLVSCDAGAAPAAELAATVSAIDNTFRPHTLRVPRAATVALTVTNDGAEEHNLVNHVHDVDTGLIPPGAEATVAIGPLARPTTFTCTLHNGMAITLVPD